jgi:hypothetical protein
MELPENALSEPVYPHFFQEYLMEDKIDAALTEGMKLYIVSDNKNSILEIMLEVAVGNDLIFPLINIIYKINDVLKEEKILPMIYLGTVILSSCPIDSFVPQSSFQEVGFDQLFLSVDKLDRLHLYTHMMQAWENSRIRKQKVQFAISMRIQQKTCQPEENLYRSFLSSYGLKGNQPVEKENGANYPSLLINKVLGNSYFLHQAKPEFWIYLNTHRFMCSWGGEEFRPFYYYRALKWLESQVKSV